MCTCLRAHVMLCVHACMRASVDVGAYLCACMWNLRECVFVRVHVELV